MGNRTPTTDMQNQCATTITISPLKIGGGRGNRTLLVSMLAKQTRSPLLPPIKNSLLHIRGSNPTNH